MLRMILISFPAFSAMRVYAISGGRWMLALVVFALNMVSVGADSVSSSSRTGPGFG